MSSLFAEVGMKGVLSALPPFDTVIKEKVIYECLAVASLKGLVSAGEKAWELYYKPYGLEETAYQLDLDNNVKILTLQSYAGQSVKVPSSYVSGLPDPSGVLYLMRALNIPISALPADVDLSILKRDIADMILHKLGVSCTIHELTYGPDIALTQDQHVALSAHRSSVMTDNGSNQIRIYQLTNMVADQMAKIKLLEDYIAKNLID